MLASVVREIVAPLLPSCPPECGVVTITEVEVSGDCSYATVYLSAIEHVEQALLFFEERHSELQKCMMSLRRRQIPQLRFRIDPRSERAARIDEFLRR